jgi:outer membrane protein
VSRRPVFPPLATRRALLWLGLAAFAACDLASRAGAQPVPAPAGGLDLLGAVRLALAQDPNLTFAETRLQVARGALLAAAGQFDPLLSTGVERDEQRIPLAGGAHRRTRVTTSDLGLGWLLRSGLSLEPGFVLQRNEEPTAGSGAANLAIVSFTLRQPLLRGRGRAVVTAFEQAAEREVAASSSDLRQTTAARVFTVASQYWLTRAAALNLEILRASEASSRELRDTTRRLIEADQTPAAELVQLEANLAAKESSRIAGERQLFEARQALGREIGLDPPAIAALPLPADPFPAIAPETMPADAAERLVALSLSRRDDLAAARERLAAVDLLLRATTDTLQPRLDLVVTPGYTGRVDGTAGGDYVSPLIRGIPGLSSTVGLRLSWPTANRTARGELVQRLAARRQSELVIDLLAKAVGADVPAAVDAVARDAQQVAKAREAVGLFERAVVNEEKKLRAGSSTLLDLISQRDRLTAARQSEVSTRLALALALLDLRFQTGTLLEGGLETGSETGLETAPPERAAVTAASLTTVPQPEEP